MDLFAPVWMTKKTNKIDKAIKAVKTMSSDQRELVQVAENAHLQEIRLAAISMITDDEALCEIALRETCRANAEEAIERIQNRAYLEKIARESPNESVRHSCMARIICGNIDFESISTEEVVDFFSKLNERNLNEFARTASFDIALSKFFDNDHPVHFSQVPEEIAINLWSRVLLKYCKYRGINQVAHGFLDEKQVEMWAPEFKRIWEITPYRSFKELISRYIWPYSTEVAEYMIYNDVECGFHNHSPLARSKRELIERIDKFAVLSYAAKNSTDEEIRQLAMKKLKEKVSY